MLRPDSLRSITRPFLDDPRTVAAGGIIRIANGCDVVNGWLVRTGLPRVRWPLLQVVEYCRAFLFGRLGWNPINGLLVISGAFGVFHKETVIEVGGYRRNTIGEDMELVVRLHRILSRERPAVPHRLRARAGVLDRGAREHRRRCGASGSAGSAASARACG